MPISRAAKRQVCELRNLREKNLEETLQLHRSKSQNYFCSKSHQTLWRNRIFKGENHPNWKGGENVEYRKILINNGIKPICKLCGCEDGRVLEVHHLDKDHKNNVLNNLAFLCRNCHHLVHCHEIRIN